MTRVAAAEDAEAAGAAARERARTAVAGRDDLSAEAHAAAAAEVLARALVARPHGHA